MPAANSLADELFPRTVEGATDALQRRQQNVHLTGLDFLDGAGVQVGEFGKALLRHPFRATLAAHVPTKLLELRFNLLVRWHALLSRENQFD
jgi:hypothetical protein